MKPNRQILIFFAILFALSSRATLFLENSIEDRLKNATGVIHGRYQGSSYKKLPNGSIVTESSFEIMQTSGIKPGEIINPNSFKVLHPGGKWNGLVHKIPGSPNFKRDEEVYLIIKKDKFGYLLPNLGMSKFHIIREDGKKKIQSQIFGDKDGIGKLDLETFSSLCESTFGEPLKEFVVDRFVDKTEFHASQNTEMEKKRKGRAVASTKSKEDDGDESIPVIWFVLLFGIIGSLPTFLLKGRRNE